MQELREAFLHTEADKERNSGRIRRVFVLFAIWTVIAIIGIVASMIWRDNTHMHNANEMPSQIITIAITLVWGCVIIFMWGMKLSPLLSYRRYMKELTSGLSRTVDGVVTGFDADTTFRDGLSFYGMIVNVGDLKNEEDERRLYWDAQLKRPDIAEGDLVHIVAHGNDIISLEKQ